MLKPLAVLLCLCSLAAAAAPTYDKAKLLDVRPYVDKDFVPSQNGTVSVEHDMYEITLHYKDLALTGLTEKKWKWSFDPASFVVGDELDVRVDAKNFFVRRADGKEMKARIIRRERVPDSSAAAAAPPSHSK